MATTDTNVIIYSTPTCAFCNTEKQYFEKMLGIDFIVRDVENDEGAMEELIAKSSQQSVPVTDIDGVIIRGFDRAKIDATLREKGIIK